MEYRTMTAVELGRRIRNREISALRVTEEAIRLGKDGDAYNAYLSIDEEGAMEQAERVEEELHVGKILSPLAGVPIALKDNILIRGKKTTCASKMMEHFVSPYSATVVEKLIQAGVVIIGKTNLDEFAMGNTSEYSYFGPVKNPFDLQRVPGGSSGGSAAAVAGRLVPLALGTDTGGSIRQPAGFCGVTGLKPTYGAVSRYGAVAHASSLDQIGPFARTAADCREILSLIQGKDPRDGTSMGVSLKETARGFSGKRIGIPHAYFDQGIDTEVREAIFRAANVMKEAGAVLVDLTMETVDYAIPAYYIVSSAEASSNLARFDGIKYGYRAEEFTDLEDLYVKSRSEGFGTEVKRRIMLGNFVLSSGYYDAYYKRAMQVRTLIKQEFDAALLQCDAILSPVSPVTTPRIGDREDPQKIRMMDLYTVSVNMAGLPALALPCGQDGKGMPIGMQLIGKAFSDGELLSLGESYQELTGYHGMQPPGTEGNL